MSSSMLSSYLPWLIIGRFGSCLDNNRSRLVENEPWPAPYFSLQTSKQMLPSESFSVSFFLYSGVEAERILSWPETDISVSVVLKWAPREWDVQISSVRCPSLRLIRRNDRSSSSGTFSRIFFSTKGKFQKTAGFYPNNKYRGFNKLMKKFFRA